MVNPSDLLFVLKFKFTNNFKLFVVGLPLGSASQKGTVMGILRSLGALARALGPVVCSSGKEG